MDRDYPAHRKKKPRDTSRSERRSDHKHEYEPCIVRFIAFFNWGERCRICGRTREKWGRDDDFLRPESIGKPGISTNDFLSVRELREKFPGVSVYEQYFEGHDLRTKELFE